MEGRRLSALERPKKTERQVVDSFDSPSDHSLARRSMLRRQGWIYPAKPGKCQQLAFFGHVGF